MIHLTRGQVVTFGLTWFTYCTCYFLRKPVAYLKMLLEPEFHLSKADLGLIDVSLLLPYALMQVFGSAKLDSYDPSKVISIFLTVAIISTALTGITHSLGTFCLCLTISGVSQAPLWPACTKMISRWFSGKVLGTTIGLMSTAPYLGSFISTSLVAYISDRWSWRYAYLPMAFAGTINVLLVLFCWHDKSSSEEKTVKTSKTDSLSISQLWRIPAIPEIAVSAFCLKFVRYCLLMWLPLYLNHVMNYPKIKTGIVSTSFDIGGIFGSPLLGYLSDRSKRGPLHVLYLAVFISGMVLSVLLIFNSVPDIVIMAVLLVAGICNCGSDTLLTGSITTEIGNRGGLNAGAAVTSLSNGIATFGGIIEGPVVALFFSLFGWKTIIIISVIMSLLSAVSIRKAHEVSQEEIKKLTNVLPH